MIIRCPSCGSTYDISKQPQAAGRKVKCMRCAHVWKAEPVDSPIPANEPRREPSVAAPPPPPSEIAIPRSPAMPSRAIEATSMAGLGEGAVPSAEPPPAPVVKARNGFNGLNGDHHGNGYAEEVSQEPQPVAPALRRTSDFEEMHRTRRQVAAPQADADYFDNATPPQRPGRRPEQKWREPPRESYRDDAYGDIDHGYGQDEFTPSRDARGRHQAPSRGRRAAAIVGWVAYLAAVGALGAYVYTGRDQIVSWLPGAAPYYQQFGLPVNQYGLAFKDVKAEWGKVSNGQAELAISIGVANVTDTAQKVPTVVIAFKDANGDEIFYRAMSDALPKTLQAGKSAKFSASLQVPAEATRAIQIRFARGL